MFEIEPRNSRTMSLEEANWNPANPSAWHTLFVDQTQNIDLEVKAAYLRSVSGPCRRWFLPILRPFLHLMMGLIHLLKMVTPRGFRSHKLLHWIVSRGLYYFVSPEANFLILRHFHLGTQVLDFFTDNLECGQPPLVKLYPRTVLELADNQVIQHDINLYNFITHLNIHRKTPITFKKNLDLRSVKRPPVELADMPRGLFNVLDLETAFELIAPVFYFFCTDDEYWRATISLQLDESIATIAAKLLGEPARLAMVNNKHPMVPHNLVEGAHRLVLHGMSTESFHKYLMDKKTELQTC